MIQRLSFTALSFSRYALDSAKRLSTNGAQEKRPRPSGAAKVRLFCGLLRIKFSTTPFFMIFCTKLAVINAKQDIKLGLSLMSSLKGENQISFVFSCTIL